MSFQRNSIYYPNGHPRNHAIIASVYFPYEADRLDGGDRGILNQVSNRYNMILLGRRVSFTFVGFADYRGTRSFNINLGNRRAVSVKNYLDSRLGQNRFYSSYAAVSRGEEDAYQNHPSQEQMALDRRVDVWCSWVHRRVVVNEPILVQGTIPQVRRVTYRYFSKFSAENMGVRPSTDGIDSGDFREGVNSIIAIARGDMAIFENTWGNEVQRRRQTSEFPANYKVNVVRMTKEYMVNTRGFARIEQYNASITYEWGRPRAQVQVHETMNTLGRTTRGSRSVPRNEADQSPVLNPPDP